MELTPPSTEDFANFIQPIAGVRDALVFQSNLTILFFGLQYLFNYSDCFICCSIPACRDVLSRRSSLERSGFNRDLTKASLINLRN
jgi:hypothetical protein